jgi:hypothetical protein
LAADVVDDAFNGIQKYDANNDGTTTATMPKTTALRMALDWMDSFDGMFSDTRSVRALQRDWEKPN